MDEEKKQEIENIFRLSVSKKSTFDSCKKKYNFCYNLKLPRKEADYHVFGKFCHSVLENFHKKILEEFQNLLPEDAVGFCKKIMREKYDLALIEYPKMTESQKKEAILLLGKYMNKVIKKFPKVKSCEYAFNFQILEDLSLIGYIDRIDYVSKRKLIVADYKTSKSSKYLKKEQLMVYAYILFEEDKDLEEIEGKYIMLKEDSKEVCFSFNRKSASIVKDNFINIYNQVKKETLYEPTPTILCNYCDYQDVCEEGLVFRSSKRPSAGWAK